MTRRPVWRRAAASQVSWLVLSFLGLTLAYHALYSRFFLNESGTLCRDYTFCMPHILAGFYWSEQNGFLTLPWFSPHACGGVPYFAHPQSMYLSLPQFLTQWLQPLSAVYSAFILFAFAGLAGFYVLLCAHRCRPSTALLGAALFMFNGFYAYRITIGHLMYHGFMLLPWMLYFLTAKREVGEPRVFEPGRAVAAALCFAYVVYSGGLNLVVPMAMSLALAIGLIELFHPRRGLHWTRFLTFCAVFLALVAMKVNLAVEVMENLPRSAYPLPGFDDPLDTVWVPLKLFFWQTETPRLANPGVMLARHEWEFGVGVVPALILLAAAGRWLIAAPRRLAEGVARPGARRSIALAVVLGIVLGQAALTWFSPGWNEFLKQVPLIETLSSPFRWYSAFIAPIVLLACLVLERRQLGEGAQWAVVSGGLALLIFGQVSEDRTFYENQRYRVDAIARSHRDVKATGRVPAIETIHVHRVKNPATNRLQVRPKFQNADDSMTSGGSHLYCDEDLFGYKSEFFPMKQLRPGSVYDTREGVFNIKNPAGYVFPEENRVDVGGHFRTDQREDLENFVHYRPFSFEMPARQQFLNVLSGLALLFCTLVAAAASAAWLRRLGA